MMKAFVAAAGLLILSGCVLGKTKEDHSWSAEQVAKLQVGKTNKAEVLLALGPPKQVVRLLDSEAYMYTHAIEKSTNTWLLVLILNRHDRQYDSITVIIGRDGIVQAVGSRFGSESASYGPPWGD